MIFYNIVNNYLRLKRLYLYYKNKLIRLEFKFFKIKSYNFSETNIIFLSYIL